MFLATAFVKRCAPARAFWIPRYLWPGRGGRINVMGFIATLATMNGTNSLNKKLVKHKMCYYGRKVANGTPHGSGRKTGEWRSTP
jgi:hypothetical protein